MDDLLKSINQHTQALLEMSEALVNLTSRQLEHEREAWELGDYIPSTYIEDGIRHITVFDLDEPVRYKYDPVEGLKQVSEVF